MPSPAPNKCFPYHLLAAFVAAGTFAALSTPPLHAAILTFDSPHNSPASPVDGSGTWDNFTANWSNASDPSGQTPNTPSDAAWSTNVGGTAVFGHGGGTTNGAITNFTITVAAGGVNAGAITFAPLALAASSSHGTDYQLSGGPITLGQATTTITVNNVSSQSLATIPDAEIASQLIGTANLVITGPGALSIGNNTAAANNYSGTTTISTNVLIGNVSGQSRSNTVVTTPFGAAGNSVVLSNATLTTNASGGTQVLPYNFTIPANTNNFIIGGKATTLGGTSLTTYGSVIGSGSLTFNLSAATCNLYANFSTFTGSLILNGGGFARGYISGGAFTGGSSMSLDLESNGATPTVFTPQTSSSGNTFSFGALTSSTASAVLNGGTSGAVLYSLGASGTNTIFNGSIGSSTNLGAALTKVGGASLTLTNFNPYTGPTTISAGSLIVNGAITSSITTVGVNATLAGIGQIGLATIDNGTLSPGAAGPNSIGPLSFGADLTLGSTATYAVDYNASGSDSLSVAGNLALTAGDTLTMTALDGTFTGSFIVATYTGTLSGTFTNVPGNIHMDYSTPGIIRAQLTPEPASLGILSFAGALLACRRRGRR